MLDFVKSKMAAWKDKQSAMMLPLRTTKSPHEILMAYARILFLGLLLAP
jgi:hypothetical protein